MMNKIYDNGQYLLGKVKDILKYTNLDSVDDETTKDLIYELNECYENDEIVCVWYDNPMSYKIISFKDKDIIWESK